MEFPELQKIHNKYKGNKKVNIYSVNLPVRSDSVNQAFNTLRKEGYDTSVSDSFKSLPKLMELTDTTGDFYTDLLVGYVLTAVASGATIIKSLNDA